MLNDSPARDFFGRLMKPTADFLGSAGVHPNTVTVVGTVGTSAGSVVLIGNGWLLAGCLVVTVFVFLDLLDGAMARATGKVSKFGAVLDATGDRLSDAAIFGSLAYWLGVHDDQPALVIAALLCLVLGQVTSYVKARAEGVGLTCNVGIAERAERLIIVLVGIGLAGLGVPFVLAVALWLLTVLSLITVIQRLVEVFRQSNVALERSHDLAR